MVEELGIDVPDDAWGPYRDGVVMFISYTTLGALPLLPYGFAGERVPGRQGCPRSPGG